jgi:putative SOS response-associated peptidase YedK
MCGRYASSRSRQELLEEFQVERDRVTESLEPDYNVAPTKPVYAVLTRAARSSRERAAGESAERESAERESAERESAERESAERGSADQDVARELRVVRWGLVPFWAKDAKIGSRMINARAETVDTKPVFRRAFARRRCLLPADGYFEWQKTGDPSHPRKQPYFIHRADGGVLAFAGLYELWRDKAVPDDDPDAWLWSATIITTQAKDDLGKIHDRMPMVIEPARWAEWLDPRDTSAEALHTLLAPAVSAHLTSHPVSTDVNAVRHNGPGLIAPVAADPEPAVEPPATPPRAGAGERGAASPSAHSTLF